MMAESLAKLPSDVLLHLYGDDKSTLFQVMAWCCQAAKPLPAPMLTQFATRPQLVNRESDVSKPGIFQGWVHISYMWTYWWNVKLNFRNSWVAMVNYRNHSVTQVYRGWLNVFVPVRMPPPLPAAHFCSLDNFWTTFQISFIFGRINDPDM